MEYHQKTIRVKQDDLDDLQHVNNVRYLEWIQDISKEHWMLKAPESIKKEFVWVVLSHHIVYRKAAFLGEELLIKTHVAQNSGVTSKRIVEITHPERGLLVRSETDWCLLNGSTLKPMRIPNSIKSLFTGENK
ncbi:acyl-CoA thioesterase [Lentiprolixibacter aurantiacus]|uniref:Thioesterase family protein n=1 Tax=Lentiprolixibacter aurantiacus TaxID=2993939 RepID=A0AAE3SNA8_9FLAO|nr:thioesterase family protein [Lentiprolixibacter aurantiacus]MCX2719414.1 thioesterase family protein [Lentiprolixibacter aurantiacus]